MSESDLTTKRILDFIENLGLSKSEFADSIGINRSMVSHLLSGRNKPSLAVVERMALTYPELDLRWLITGEEHDGIQRPEKELDVQKPEPPPVVPFQQTENTPRQEPDQRLSQAEHLLVLHPDGTYQRFLPRK